MNNDERRAADHQAAADIIATTTDRVVLEAAITAFIMTHPDNVRS